MPTYGPFHDLVGPLYESRRDGRLVIGLHMTTKHQNGGNMMHGGMLLMLADTAMTRGASIERPIDRSCVTSTLSSEFIAAGRVGDWIEAEVETLRKGRSVIFMQCLIRREGPAGPLLMRASATFQVIAKVS